jgi:hypothetical protein
MERTYDIFEKTADGALLWRTTVTGHEAAIAKLKELAAKNANEFRVMHLPTQALVAAMNVSKPD